MLKIFVLFSPILFQLIVCFLGFLTPGYNQLTNTISRLAIEKYGFWQQLNFIQLAYAILLSGKFFVKTLKEQDSKEYIGKFYYFIFGLILIATFVPTDKLENVTTFNPAQFSILGLIHLSIVLLFVLFSPFGIYRLYKIFKAEKYYQSLTKFTIIMGSGSLIMSLLWIFFFLSGFLSEYRGLFQKIIVFWTSIWITTVNYKVSKYKNN